MSKIKDKEWILKAAREKEDLSHTCGPVKKQAVYSVETMNGGQKEVGMLNLKGLKKKNLKGLREG